LIYFISFILFLIANIIFVLISYNDAIRLHEYKGYAFGYMASIFSMSGWYLLIKNSNYNSIYFIDLIWEVSATLFGVFIPFIFFNINFNLMTIVGIFLSIIGLVVIKLSEFYK